MRGSSPLTRGKLEVVLLSGTVEGLIPAHAGKTRGTGASRRGAGAHPRSRGENSHANNMARRAQGSSPLTRGKPVRVRGCGVRRGLIPAHAGKTPGPAARSGSGRAHPRSRGENASSRSTVMPRSGSSPLTRGKRVGGEAGRVRHGLIPAHAGKTIQTTVQTVAGWAHPRSRGENLGGGRRPPGRRGSSPLTRGKPAGRAAGQAVAGLIPAHAGKTGWPGRSGRWRRAHPRSRGENKDGAGKDLIRWGSSPLTRGKLRIDGTDTEDEGLIPAHAGKTDRRTPLLPWSRAHPRSRGENGR